MKYFILTIYLTSLIKNTLKAKSKKDPIKLAVVSYYESDSNNDSTQAVSENNEKSDKK